MTYDVNEIINILNHTKLEEHLNKYHDFNYGDVSMIRDYLPEGWDVYSGCTKCVIVPPPGYDYVIKLPFNTDYYEDMDEDESCATLEGGYLPISEQYTGNYCAVEEELSYLAEDEGVAEFFALTKHICNICNGEMPVYIQERCDGLGFPDANPSLTPEAKRTAGQIQDNSHTLYGLRKDFLAAGVLVYGPEALKKLDNFIENWSIQDLHDGNYGYKHLTFIPKIFDFSGYEG